MLFLLENKRNKRRRGKRVRVVLKSFCQKHEKCVCDFCVALQNGIVFRHIKKKKVSKHLLNFSSVAVPWPTRKLLTIFMCNHKYSRLKCFKVFQFFSQISWGWYLNEIYKEKMKTILWNQASRKVFFLTFKWKKREDLLL